MILGGLRSRFRLAVPKVAAWEPGDLEPPSEHPLLRREWGPWGDSDLGLGPGLVDSA